MKFRSVMPAALFAFIAMTATANAQSGVAPLGGTWDGVYTPGTNVDEFWNNLSDDGRTCNIGYFVRGAGFGPCSDQHPNPFASPLGWANATYLAAGTPSSTFRTLFQFGPGTYNISFLGQIAGANPARLMGVRTTGTDVGPINITFGTAPSMVTVTATSAFEFFLQSWSPLGAGTFYSRTASPGLGQFAVFANGPDGQTASEWLVGAEDNACMALSANCSRVSDFDFNDGFALVQLVPEPSTYALMAVGLLAMGGLARRRRKVA